MSKNKQLQYNWIYKIARIAILNADEIEEIVRTEDDEFTEAEQAYIDEMDKDERATFDLLPKNMEKFTYLGAKIKVDTQAVHDAKNPEDLVDLSAEQLEEYNSLATDEEKESFLTEHKAKKPGQIDDATPDSFKTFKTEDEFKAFITENQSKLQKKNTKLTKDNKALQDKVNNLQEQIDAAKMSRRGKRVFGTKTEIKKAKKTSNGVPF